MKTFHFKTWHFILLFLIMFVSTNILGHIGLKTATADIEESCFIEINDKVFTEATSSGINYVFLYAEDSELCNKMEYQINQLAKSINNEDINFYKLNIQENSDQYSRYNIFGVPFLLVFQDGKEIERVTGIVPLSNLKIIHNRIIK